MNPPADFLIFGGDLAQLGDPVELQLGAELLKEVKIKKVFIPGEHDWYLDMGAMWNKTFGATPWTFDHKGVRIIGLDTVSHAPDFWTQRKYSPKERMGHMATLDGTLGGAWSAVGDEAAAVPQQHARQLGEGQAGDPLHPHAAVRVLPGRGTSGSATGARCTKSSGRSPTSPTCTATRTRCSTTRSARCARSACSPPRGRGRTRRRACRRLTKPMIRADPGDHFDGVGWAQLTVSTARPRRQRIQDVAQDRCSPKRRPTRAPTTTATRC